MDIKPIIVSSLNDLPEAPVSQGVTLVKKTGTWKNVRPVTVSRSAPCENACPLRIRIPDFINFLTTNSDAESAALEIIKWNPFPTITGRLCPAKCEVGCNRNKYDDKISIKELERFLGDLYLDKKSIDIKEKKHERVAILGGSISGMAASYILLKEGFEVHLFLKGNETFEDIRGKVPEEILGKELKILQNAGLRLNVNTSAKISELQKEFKYIFVSSSSYPQMVSIEDPKTGKTNFEGAFSSKEDQDISRTIKNAIGVAIYIASKASGKEYKDEEKLPRVVSYKEIIEDYFNHENAVKEINELEDAIKEASRCFSCGTCNSCGNCYVFCPDSAVKWVNNLPEFDYDYCKGCGICVTECPRGILELIPEK